ncbi:MAG: class I SAM-dependent rRNA methyltransferase [Oscillospiraceae bacterium]|jgi:23S rRNA (cytosine1962-C5)-methyltransferase|nr:class I SAM-dependent rRNA methyltransferase [Oscillospiraceae bacterium]
MLTATLAPGKEKRVQGGHPWVFRSDIAATARDSDWSAAAPLAEVRASNGRFLARAMYNPASQIALRVLSREDEPIDERFFQKRVERAVSLRRRFSGFDACRLVFAESDGLPAFIADRFGEVIAVQSLALGIEPYKGWITAALIDQTGVANVWERSDAPVRALEGLPMTSAILSGSVPDTVRFSENGLNMLADVKNGQKTGYFLDQKENRASIAPYVGGARVLDCFTHTGSFAIHAARYGAAEVMGVDVSREALDLARENARLNGVEDRVRFEAANAFDYLRARQSGALEVIILDPPAFTKSRAALDSALRGYKEINLRAMKLLADGGILITCSCSQHVSADEFGAMLHAAARDAKRTMRVLEKRGAGRDHPVLMGARETEYLKFWITQISKQG